jgi:uncharacterized OB-fold protein
MIEPTTQPLQRGFVRPEIEVGSEWWWDALAEGSLMLPRCTSCGRCSFPPMPACPHCSGTSFERVLASGRGTIYSWVVVRYALDPAFVEDVPYALAVVDLEEGARAIGRVHGEFEQIQPASPVQAFAYVVQDATLLGFELV